MGKKTNTLTKSDINGIFVPMVTPMKRNESEDLDFDATGKLSNYMIENGVQGIMPLGTSGEFALLTKEERKDFIEAAVKAASGRVPVVAGVSSPGTKNAIALAQDAREVGADAVIATGPFYYKTSSEGLLTHYQTILEHVDLPLMIYNIPSWVGYDIPASIVKKLVERNPGRVIGVKFTTNDLAEFLAYLRLLKEDISIMIGSDPLIFSALELGAAGAVVGSGNVLPKETSEIYENQKRGMLDTAKEFQKRIDPFTETMVLGTYPAAIKEALRLLGIECGTVRKPLVSLSQLEIEKVRNSIAWKMNERRS